MTSKRYFYKIMREDFRHKVWMLALSVLGNFLALPVTLLILVENMGRFSDMTEVAEFANCARSIMNFFTQGMLLTGGVIAIAGALIVGLFGFRYVFHKNMVDTYHSIPTKRRTLFAAGWLNGFLIWLVPFVVCLVITVILGAGRLDLLRDAAFSVKVLRPGDNFILAEFPTVGSLLVNVLLTVLALAVVFLLVYHLVLLAVMLCGNVLNTLITTGILGVGAISLYGMIFAFCEVYLNTFIESMKAGIDKVIYGSPLGSAVYILIMRAAEYDNPEEVNIAAVIVLNLLIAVGMGILALVAYLKRPSELAEQGIANKPVRYLLQTLTTVVAAQGGWLLFCVFTNDVLLWNIFGMVLVGVLAFGILDIVFRMDFKAFFAHKLRMAATLAGSLLLGLTICFDWIGYDTYLPKQEKIAEIAVYHNQSSEINFNQSAKEEEDSPLSRVHIKNQEAAHAFLKTVTEFEKSRDVLEEEYNYVSDDIVNGVYARVTLQSGRSYYREYRVRKSEAEVLYALVATPEYMDVNYKIDEAVMQSATEISFRQGAMRKEMYLNTEADREVIKAICEAYNRDVEEQPDLFIRGTGKMLGGIRVWANNSSRWMDIYEEMHHTREVLHRFGYGEYAEQIPAEDIEEIRLQLGYVETDEEDLLRCAARYYGVYPAGVSQSSEKEEVPEINAELSDTKGIPQAEEYQEIYVSITDKAEIEELLDIASVGWKKGTRGLFWDNMAHITVVEKDGSMFEAYVKEGDMPEKFILKFGEL